MIRRSNRLLISLGDVPKGAIVGRRIPDAKHPDRAFFDPKLEKPADPQHLLGDMNTAFFRREERVSAGVAPRRYYVNKASALFFGELDKGTRSPWVVGAYLICAFLACQKIYRMATDHIHDEKEYRATMYGGIPYASSVPFQPSHNLAVGLKNRYTTDSDQMSTVTPDLASDIPDEKKFQPPRLIHTEKSEALATSKDNVPADMVIIERREYDGKKMRDYVYRMVQYIYEDDVQEKADDVKALKKVDQDVVAFQKKKAEWLNSLPLSRRQERARPDHVHGLVKCLGIDANNNCVPLIGDAQNESVRKLLLALGPTHMLRDPGKTSKRDRFTTHKEIDTNILVMGMRGAEIPNAVRHFANFKVDIVEKDPSIVRIARKYLGFKEQTGHTVLVEDPMYVVRKIAADSQRKRYDLVYVDALDGKGRLNPGYSGLEFVDSVRNIMSEAGVVAVNLPNDDVPYYYNCLQNWRMGFNNKLCILVHCQTTQNTILMSFQDDSGRGKPIMGSCGNHTEFADIIKAFITFYPVDKHLNFDLLNEIDPHFFSIFNAGDKLDLSRALPPNHPLFRDRKAFEKMCDTVGSSKHIMYAGAGATVGEGSRAQQADISPVRYVPPKSTKEY